MGDEVDPGFRGHGICRKRPLKAQSAGLTYLEKQQLYLGLLAEAGDSNTAGSSMLPATKRQKRMKLSQGWTWGEKSKEQLQEFNMDSKPNNMGLREMCTLLHLVKSGNKGVVIQRLLEYQAQAKAAAPPTVSLPEAGEAGDGAVQGEADASVPAVQAEAPAPAAPQPPPGQKQDLESEMTGHQGLPTAQAIPNFDSMMQHVLSYGSLLGPI